MRVPQPSEHPDTDRLQSARLDRRSRVTVSRAATSVTPGDRARVWALMVPPSSGVVLAGGEVTDAWVEEGTGPGLGEVQVFARRTRGGRLRVVTRSQVVGYDEGRRAVTRSVSAGRAVEVETSLDDLDDGRVLVTHRYTLTGVRSRHADKVDEAFAQGLATIQERLPLLLGPATEPSGLLPG